MKTLSVEDLAAIAERHRLGVTRPQLDAFQVLLDQGLRPLVQLDELAGHRPAPERTPGSSWSPSSEENRFAGWMWRMEIQGAASGLLAGKSVAIKDCITVGGLPLTTGTAMLEGRVAQADATAVSHVLDAGGTILGTATCEAMWFSGGSHTSAHGVARNPYDPSRTTGGSSTGCAALLASHEVDLAIAPTRPAPSAFPRPGQGSSV